MRFERGVFPLSSADLARRSKIANHSGRMRVVEFLIAYAAFRICKRKKSIKGREDVYEEIERRGEMSSHPFVKREWMTQRCVVEEKR